MKQFKYYCALVFAGLAAGPLMAQTLVGEAGDWLIMRMDNRECWMATGSSSSLFALTLDRNQQAGIVFSVKRETAPPPSIPVAIKLVNIPLADEPVGFESQFSLVRRKGSEFFYQSKLSKEQFDMVTSFKVITFTEMMSGSGEYSRITSANKIAPDAAALRLLHDCGARL